MITSDGQCVLPIEGLTGNALSVAPNITIKSVVVKMNGQETWQIWIRMNTIRSPLNTTD